VQLSKPAIVISGLAVIAAISVAGVGYYFRSQRIRQQEAGNTSDVKSPAPSSARVDPSPAAILPLSASITDVGHIEPQRKPTLTQTKDGKEYILRSYGIDLRLTIPNGWEVIEGMNGINLVPVNAAYPHIGLSPVMGFPFSPDAHSYVSTSDAEEEIVSSNLGWVDGHRILKVRTRPTKTRQSTDETHVYMIAVDLGNQDSLVIDAYYDQKRLAEHGTSQIWTLDRFISTVDQVVSTFQF
jgi:hypothetical protein